MPAPIRGKLYRVVGADESIEFLRHAQLIEDAWDKTMVPVCEQLGSLNHFSILETLSQPRHRLHQLAAELMYR